MKLIDFLVDSSAYVKNDDRTMTIRNSSDGMVFTVYEIGRYARRIPILTPAAHVTAQFRELPYGSTVRRENFEKESKMECTWEKANRGESDHVTTHGDGNITIHADGQEYLIQVRGDSITISRFGQLLISPHAANSCTIKGEK